MRRLFKPLTAASAALFFALPFFIPNPLLDAALSGASAAAGYPARFERARFALPSARLDGLHFYADEVRLRPLAGSNPMTQAFLGKEGLEDWLSVRRAHLVFVFKSPAFYVRILDARTGPGHLRGGVRLDGGKVSKWSLACWLPESVWGRFPELVGKRFSRDAGGRRLFKLTWNGGRWRLWGRSAPVLEASWR